MNFVEKMILLPYDRYNMLVKYQSMNAVDKIQKTDSSTQTEESLPTSSGENIGENHSSIGYGENINQTTKRVIEKKNIVNLHQGFRIRRKLNG